MHMWETRRLHQRPLTKSPACVLERIKARLEETCCLTIFNWSNYFLMFSLACKHVICLTRHIISCSVKLIFIALPYMLTSWDEHTFSLFLQYFDTVGWVYRLLTSKTVSQITYTVLVETLKTLFSQLINQRLYFFLQRTVCVLVIKCRFNKLKIVFD